MQGGLSIPSTIELWLSLILIAGVLVLCYYMSRFIAKKMGGGATSSTKQIKIIERVAFSQDKCLAICRVCDSYYLIGVATQNIKILARLDPSYFNEKDELIDKKMSVIDFLIKKLPKNTIDSDTQT